MESGADKTVGMQDKNGKFYERRGSHTGNHAQFALRPVQPLQATPRDKRYKTAHLNDVCRLHSGKSKSPDLSQVRRFDGWS